MFIKCKCGNTLHPLATSLACTVTPCCWAPFARSLRLLLVVKEVVGMSDQVLGLINMLSDMRPGKPKTPARYPILSREPMVHCSPNLESNRSTFLTAQVGTPMATLHGGISLVPTLPAAIVHPSPIDTPGRVTLCPPIQRSSPKCTGRANSMLARRR